MVAKLSDRVEGNTLANPDDFVKKAGDTMTGRLSATGLEVDSTNQFSILTLKSSEDSIRNCLAYWESTSNVTDDRYNIVSRDIDGFGNTKAMFKAEAYGETELYYDGIFRLRTKTDGVQIIGNVSADGVRVGDNEVIGLGNSNDLTLVHNGSNAFIRNQTGIFLADSQGGEFRVATGASSKSAIRCFPDASVQLFHNNSLKFNTTTTGIAVNGIVEANGLTMSDNHYINLGASTDLSIFHNATNSYITNNTGLLAVESKGGEFRVTTGVSGKKAIRCLPDAQTELYYNNSNKLFTTNAGGTLNGTWSGGGLSDERLKENIETRNGLDNILSLTGIDWDWKEDIDFDVEGAETSGFTAQNWAEVYPEQVSEVFPELPKPEPELDEDGQPIEAAEPVEPEEIDNTGRTDGKLQINRNLNSQKFDADVC